MNVVTFNLRCHTAPRLRRVVEALDEFHGEDIHTDTVVIWAPAAPRGRYTHADTVVIRAPAAPRGRYTR